MLTWLGAATAEEVSAALVGGLRWQPQGYDFVLEDIKEREGGLKGPGLYRRDGSLTLPRRWPVPLCGIRGLPGAFFKDQELGREADKSFYRAVAHREPPPLCSKPF